MNLRLSAGVEASYSIEPADERITVRSETIRAGVVRVLIEGVTPGESGVELQATASGYQTATASFAVVVDDTGFGVTLGDAGGCRVLDDLREITRLIFEEGIDASLEFVTEKILAGQCGLFEEGAEVEWRGEEASVFGAPAIRVWGSPVTGRDLAPAPLSPWWTLRNATSFAEDPAEASNLGPSLQGFMDRVRQIITAASG